jgi:hypothetical protein
MEAAPDEADGDSEAQALRDQMETEPAPNGFPQNEY